MKLLNDSKHWTLTLLDGFPPARELGSLAVGDIDGDGHDEIVTGGEGALLWYRPHDRAQGRIDEGSFSVGLALRDLDGDGFPELFTGRRNPDDNTWALVRYTPDPERARWTRDALDDRMRGNAHDLLFVDIDGDGKPELLANEAYCDPEWAVRIYRPRTQTPWTGHTITRGFREEGLLALDMDGDGRLDVVSGTRWYRPPEGGPYAGLWTPHHYAPDMRDLVRVAAADLTGNGRPDLLVVESEFPDGRFAWYENRLLEDPARPWIAHPIDRDLHYAHSFQADQVQPGGPVRVFLAEMTQGGFRGDYHYAPRLLEYVARQQGRAWTRNLLHQGSGTHQALRRRIDGSRKDTIVGKDWAPALPARVQIWTRRTRTSPLDDFRNTAVDRSKPCTGTDLVAVDLTGNGRKDIACAAFWYRNRDWQRFEIPGIYQVHTAFDVDGDGREELICTRKAPTAKPDRWYSGLSALLCWAKPIDPENGIWAVHDIGMGHGDWPHATLVAPVLPGGRQGLVVGYHSAQTHATLPQLFEIPSDPTQPEWPVRTLADVPYGEEFACADITGNGVPDLVAGPWWLENMGDGSFRPWPLAEGFSVARLAVLDIDGDGRPDVVMGEESLDYPHRQVLYGRLAWFKNPEDPRKGPWPMRVIDTMRCPHSLGVGDLDGDGKPEIVAGEHEPFMFSLRTRGRLFAYKQTDRKGLAWERHLIDDRFEHHDGAKVAQLDPDRPPCIISHGWNEGRIVNLWERD